MHWFITTIDGSSIKFHTEAESSDDAFEHLAHSLKYPNYQAMCCDLVIPGRASRFH